MKFPYNMIEKLEEYRDYYSVSPNSDAWRRLGEKSVNEIKQDEIALCRLEDDGGPCR
jgi:hypothetical protein